MNPFTPGRAVDPQFFAGRKDELERFRTFLKSAREGNPMHLAILGERGIGKSSLLRMCESFSKTDRCIVARVDLDASIGSLGALVETVLRHIAQEGEAYSKLFRVSEKVKRFFDAYKVSAGAMGFSLEVEKKSPTSLPVRTELLRIWRAVKENVPAIIVMLDEAEQLERIEGSLQFLRNVFSRLAEERAGFMLLLSGKLTLFKKIKEIHSPLARFFNPISLTEFSYGESLEALEKPLHATGYQIAPEIKGLIAKTSEGHPYIIQVFGFYLCEKAPGRIIDRRVYNAALPIIMSGLTKQLFEDSYSTVSPQEQIVLRVMAREEATTVEFSSIVKGAHLPANKVGYLLNRLDDKDCIRKVARGQYRLFHGLFKEYLKNL